MEKKTTNELLDILKNTKPENVTDFLSKYRESFNREKEFAEFMRKKIREKGLSQQGVFRNADIPERYGYKLVSMEKKTAKRDIILRLCLASRFTLKETQQALELYGMSPLYSRSSRDAVLMIAVNSRLKSIPEVNELLIKHSMEPLLTCGTEEDNADI